MPVDDLFEELLDSADEQFEENLEKWVTLCGAAARKKGFHDATEIQGVHRLISPPERMMLIVSEVAEMLEAFREGNKGGVSEELADVVIRCFDFAYVYRIPLARAMNDKLRYNATRPHKHGGKVI
jgi:hypothetical protein